MLESVRYFACHTLLMVIYVHVTEMGDQLCQTQQLDNQAKISDYLDLVYLVF